jgi:hypothetical protein
VSASTSTLRTLPLMLSLTIGFLHDMPWRQLM